MATLEVQPRWLKSVHTHGLDHLGIQVVSITMYGDLLPGLTNVTDRIRYYSFFPWILHRYAKEIRSTSLTKWREHLRRAEFLLALVGKWHHREGSEGGEAVVGADLARDVLDKMQSDPKKRWRLSKWTALAKAGEAGSYFANRNGGYGQYYRSVLSELGLITIEEKAPGVGLGPDHGIKIAELCDVQPGREEFWSAVREDEVTLGLVEELGGYLCPCALTSFDEERDFLTNLMFGPDRTTGPDTRRRARSLRLLLAMLCQCDGVDNPVNEFRHVAYYGHTNSGRKYVAPSELQHDLVKWLVYEASEFVHYSLEQAFLAVLARLKTVTLHEAALESFLPRLAQESLSASSKTLKLGPDKRSWSSRTLGDLFREAATTQQPLARNADDAWGEMNLLPSPPEDDPLTVLAKSLACVLSVLARNLFPPKPFSYFENLDAEFPRRYRVNLETIRDFVQKSQERNAADAYADILSNWVVGQHIRVAMRKLHQQTQATFKVAIEEGRYVWIEDFEPTFTNPRLRQAFRFLRDLGLCGGAAEGWRLTKSGKQILEVSDAK